MITINKICGSGFQKINKVNNATLNFTRNYQKPGKDKVNLRPYHVIHNETLKHVYGIDSNIEDEKILKYIIPAINDFCEINNNYKLFKGLVLEETSLNIKNCLYIDSTKFGTGYTV